MRAYLERCGVAFDVAVNVLLGGALNQTISLRAALAQRSGRRWGCVVCAILSWAVQRNHCAAQFTDAVPGALVYVRAAAAFSVAIGASAAVLFSLSRVVVALI